MRILLLTLTLLAGTAHAAQDRFIGTWVGKLPKDPEPIVVELTFTRVDDAGIAYGMLCHIWQHLGITYIWDLGVGRGTAATPEPANRAATTLRFAFNDFEYTIAASGSKQLLLRLKRNGQVHKLRLARTDPTDAPCISRMNISSAVQIRE